MTRPNHARVGADVVHVRLTRAELECLLAALEIAGDDPYTDDKPLACGLSARLVDLLRALG